MKKKKRNAKRKNRITRPVLLISITASTLLLLACRIRPATFSSDAGAYVALAYSLADDIKNGKDAGESVAGTAESGETVEGSESDAVDSGAEVVDITRDDDRAGSEADAGTDTLTASETADPISGGDAMTDDKVAEEIEGAGDNEETEDGPREFTVVDDEYFNDALFIGDSRMVGLSEYCEPIDTRADFYVKKALTIYNLKDGKPIRSFDGTSKSLWEVLQEKTYGKIYLMVGINEIGVGDPEYFRAAYEEVVGRIRDMQPDALIFINSIMHVSKVKNDSDSLYNNTNINARNDAIKTLANGTDIFYLDVNEATDDENGALAKELTFDEVHLKGSCYEPWHEFLLEHGIEIQAE